VETINRHNPTFLRWKRSERVGLIIGGIMKTILVMCAVLLALPCIALASPVPDTGQTKCYDNTQEITCPQPGEDFYGHDAQYDINPQSYTKLDETGNDLPDEAPWPWVMVRDNVTGLIWEALRMGEDFLRGEAL
jgi:hypothetical protein